MSYALTATKRKFHRILDEISNASTTASPSKTAEGPNESPTRPSDEDSTSKRRRVTPSSFRQSLIERRLLAVPRDTTGRPATADQSTVKAVNPPRRVLGFFAPWDQNQFLRRLKTFTHEQFKGKPDAISEVEWAKRGWSCVGEETVGCVGGCESRVVVDLTIEEDEDEEFTLETYQAKKAIGELWRTLVRLYLLNLPFRS